MTLNAWRSISATGHSTSKFVDAGPASLCSIRQPPHLHMRCAENEVVIRLEMLETDAGNLARRTMGAA
jgi:hypothetical protein